MAKNSIWWTVNRNQDYSMGYIFAAHSRMVFSARIRHANEKSNRRSQTPINYPKKTFRSGFVPKS